MGHSSVAFVVGSSSPLDGGANFPLFTNAATASASHSLDLRGWSAFMTAGRACSWSVRTATARRRVCCARDVLAPIFSWLFLAGRGPRVPSDVRVGRAAGVRAASTRPGGVFEPLCTLLFQTTFEPLGRRAGRCNFAAVHGLGGGFCGVARNSNADFLRPFSAQCEALPLC